MTVAVVTVKNTSGCRNRGVTQSVTKGVPTQGEPPRTSWHKSWPDPCLATSALLADVFVPQFGLVGDEALHHVLAAFVIEHLDLHTARAQQRFLAHE